MDFSKTMIITGAGAHVPYDFPSGMKLTEMIKSLYSKADEVVSDKSYYIPNNQEKNKINKYKKEICKLIKEFELVNLPSKLASYNSDIKDENMNSIVDGFSKQLNYINQYNFLMQNQSNVNDEILEFISKDLNEFIIKFGESQTYTIDTYLYKKLKYNINNNYSNIGKLLIAYFIYKSETKIKIGFHKLNWIEYIINNFLVDESKKLSFFKNTPQFITFNYDNFFEKKIFKHLISYHSNAKELALKTVNKINVLHVYGDINSLYYENNLDTKADENMNEDRDINNALELEIYRHSMNGLKVIGEERNSSDKEKISNSIFERMKDIKQILFLGFGFDVLNTSIIFDKSEKIIQENEIQLYSTNIGISEYEQEEIQKRVPVKIEFFQGEDVDCLKLIKEKRPIYFP